VLLGAVRPPWDNVLTLLPSLLLAPALLVLLVCVHDAAPEHQQLWSRLGATFGGLYAALGKKLLGGGAPCATPRQRGPRAPTECRPRRRQPTPTTQPLKATVRYSRDQLR
jgi:hypothetical protein